MTTTTTTMTLDRKRILLIHPLGYSADRAAADIARKANLMPPIGLVSLAAYLEERGFVADVIDCFAHPDSDKMIDRYVSEHRPAFVGFTSTTSSFHDALRMAERVKALVPGLQSVFGGAHVSALKGQILERFPGVDYVAVGEGERILCELLEAGSGEGIKGIISRGASGEILYEARTDKGLELDTLPLPAYDKLRGFPDKYKLPIFNYPKAPNASCISSRGCPYQCSYCDRSVFGRSFRYNSAEYLYNHMEQLNDIYGIKHINFYDDQFTFNRERVEKFCLMMIDKPLGMTFNCAVRAEHVDEQLCLLMKRAGCWMMSLGIETGDPELLAQHRQNADLQMLEDTIRTIKRAGIRVKGLLMMGLPGESEESVQRSMEYVFSLPLDDFNLAKFTPFPGTPIYENVHDLGTFDEDWEKMDCMHFQFVPTGMTQERLEELFTLFYKKHYTRPKVMASYVTMLWKSPDSWIRFIKNFNDFWKFANTDRRRA